ALCFLMPGLTISRRGPDSRFGKADLLRALPEDLPAELAQVLVPVDDRREVVACELPRLAREVRVTIREQDLGLADAARVEDDLARVRIAGRVFWPEPEIELAEGDPAGLAAPADVDDPR